MAEVLLRWLVGNFRDPLGVESPCHDFIPWLLISWRFFPSLIIYKIDLILWLVVLHRCWLATCLASVPFFLHKLIARTPGEVDIDIDVDQGLLIVFGKVHLPL